MAHALVRTPLGFGIARFGLGLGEAGNFPAAIKTVAEWFPKRERAFATGIFNGGSNLGAIIAPAIVPFIALTWSWQAAFLITGAIGFIWLFFWLWLYRPAGETQDRLRRRARVHPQRCRGSGHADSVDAHCRQAPDLGLCHRQVPHRPGVVVLSLLAREVPQ